MTTLKTALAIALLGLAIGPAAIAGTTPQARPAPPAVPAVAGANMTIADMLKARNLPFEIDSDGDYRMVVEWQRERRSQLVFVSGRTETIKEVQIYDIFSPAFQLPEGTKLTQQQAEMLLIESARSKIGAFELHGNTVYFRIKMPAGFSPTTLDTLIHACAEIADNMEIKVNGDGPDKDKL